MSRKRSVPRSTSAEPAVSRQVVPKPADPRQPDLFEVSFIPPAKPKLADRVPVGERWQYEIKNDGYRCQAHVLDGRVRLYSKNGKPLTDCLPGITGDLGGLSVRSAVLDGEAVIVDENGVSDFWALHAAMSRKAAPEALLFAFDLLHLDGEDLRERPLSERRAMLVELLVGAGPALHLSEHHVGDGPALLKAACEMGLEGIVAKRRDSRYRTGDTDAWLKVKCTTKEPFVAMEHGRGDWGFTVRVGRLVEDKVQHCGWVGTGYTAESAKAIRRALDEGRPVVIEVEHRGWTPAGELRHASAKGFHVG